MGFCIITCNWQFLSFFDSIIFTPTFLWFWAKRKSFCILEIIFWLHASWVLFLFDYIILDPKLCKLQAWELSTRRKSDASCSSDFPIFFSSKPKECVVYSKDFPFCYILYIFFNLLLYCISILMDFLISEPWHNYMLWSAYQNFRWWYW